MANIIEIARAVKYLGTRRPNEISNPVREFLWASKQAVSAEKRLDTQNGQSENAQGFPFLRRASELGFLFREIFVDEEYRNWQPQLNSPHVIDLGGDMGALSALYWKYRVPDAKVTVVEANPATAEVMSNILNRRNITDVTVINAAVGADNIGNATLHIHKKKHVSDYVGERPGVHPQSSYYNIEVPKLKVSSLIQGGEIVDLLAVDIEGSESDVIRDLAESGRLRQIRQIIMEFHHNPQVNPNNSIAETLAALEDASFQFGETHTSGSMRKGKPVSVDMIGVASSSQKLTFIFSATRNQ